MMAFLAYTIVFWLAVAGFALMLYISTQRGNWLEKWQDKLRQWDLSGNEFMYRIGGGCQLCFSHALAQLSLILYIPFITLSIGWPEPLHAFQSTFSTIILAITWYIVYVAMATNLNLFFITKLYRHG